MVFVVLYILLPFLLHKTCGRRRPAGCKQRRSHLRIDRSLWGRGVWMSLCSPPWRWRPPGYWCQIRLTAEKKVHNFKKLKKRTERRQMLEPGEAKLKQSFKLSELMLMDQNTLYIKPILFTNLIYLSKSQKINHCPLPLSHERFEW